MPRKPSFIELRLKNIKFFDRDVFHGVKEGHRKALSKFGAFVRADARQSMRTARAVRSKTKLDNSIRIIRRKKPIRISRDASPPGTPPRAIYGQIKRFLIFEYEPMNTNVVIGPLILPSKKRTRHTVPAMHEQRQSSHAHVRRRIRNKTVTQRYPQRPFMVPAFDKNKKKLARLYRDVIKGS